MIDIHELKIQLKNGSFDKLFAEELGCDVQKTVNRVCSVVERFCESFDEENCALFSAPGRTELAGNHTDHQCGNVLAASVNADMLCAAARNESKFICVNSEGFGEICVDLNIDQPLAEEQGTAAALVRGMAVWFKNNGCDIGGMNAYVSSDVPIGSGMSSSAAFEVLLGTVFNSFFADYRFSKQDIAKAGLYAENVYFGKPCGLMDQTACAYGGIISVNFKDNDNPLVAPLKYDFYKYGYSLCLISTGGSHDDLTAEYAAITDEMRAVSSFFGKRYLSEIEQCDVIRNASGIRRQCGDRAYVRAVNYFEENNRAIDMTEALRNGDLTKYFELVNESGRCSFMYLQNIYPAGSSSNQAITVALQAAQLSLRGRGAFRVHGGGFAGTIQAYVPNDMLDEFVVDMENVIGPGCCKILKIRNLGAAELKAER